MIVQCHPPEKEKSQVETNTLSAGQYYVKAASMQITVTAQRNGMKQRSNSCILIPFRAETTQPRFYKLLKINYSGDCIYGS
uniref:Uncharacterized protein n=1 Tax=Rhizophora mucronata TaxID=61149 RepID=A0A2P2P3M7_RHIMU